MSSLYNETVISLPQGEITCIENQHITQQSNVLAIHGWLDNAASFKPLMACLPEFNWTAIDLPGHGHSFHRPAFSHYHFIDWMSDLLDIIESKFDNRPLHIVGHSLGGMLATVLAGLYPEKVEKLVLIDAAGLITQPQGKAVEQMKKALNDRSQLRNKTKRVHQSFESAVDARAAAGDLSRTSAELLVARNVTKTQQGYEWLTDQRLKANSPIRIDIASAQQIIAHIEADTLICMGNQGYDSMKDNLQRYRAFYKKLTWVEVIGGHHCHMDHPKSTAEAIKSFMS